MAAASFLASFGMIGLRLVELHGIEPKAFAQRIGLARTTPAEANARLPSDLADKAFRLAMEWIPDPAFALKAAQCWHPSHLGVLGYAWLSSGSLRTALQRMQRYLRILGQRASCRCEETAEGLRFSLDSGRGDTPVGHVVADFSLSIILSLCRTNLDPSLRAVAAGLRRPPPVDRQPYDDFFGCPVKFGATADYFVLSRRDVDQPLLTANRELAATFDAILATQLAELRDGDLESRCRGFLLQAFTSGEPSEEGLASALAMSRRTLQRKLGELGLTYRGLLERTRYDLALRYLDDPRKTVTDITFLLGFSEQSAFTRAFKRWHGHAPTAYRERLVRA